MTLTIALPFLIGLTHSLETDHVLAVATMNTKEQSHKISITNGMVWGIGHSISIIVLGSIFILFSYIFQNQVPFNLEVPVGLMLVIMGLYKLFNQEKKHEKKSSFLFVGLIHGVAGSAGIALMSFMGQTTDPYSKIICLFSFSLGAILGMGTLNLILTKLNKIIINLKIFSIIIPIASISYGGYLILINI